MKYLLSIIKSLIYTAVVILLCLLAFAVMAQEDYSKEQLQSVTEQRIRSDRERYNRLINNELLDDNSRFYYDGNDVYPAIIIDGLIFPAVVNGTRRIPGCVAAKKVLPGKYDREENLVICELVASPKVGKTSILISKVAQKSSTNSKIDSKVTPKVAGTTRSNKINTKRSKSSRRSKATAVTTANKNSIATNVLEVNGYRSRPKFGVRAGTWAKVLLPRSVSSSEATDIELELVEDIVGIHRNIPVGTIFFANHNINPSTQRLDMLANLMVMPDGTEYKITASIHSLSRSAGLLGAIITHSDKVATISAQRSLLEATKSTLKNQGNPVGDLAGNVAGSVINAQGKSLPTIPDYSVQVASQEALIRFGRSF